MGNILVGLLVVCCLTTQAQKVAVVMSGGAANGIAHIGMLKALEEAGFGGKVVK